MCFAEYNKQIRKIFNIVCCSLPAEAVNAAHVYTPKCVNSLRLKLKLILKFI